MKKVCLLLVILLLVLTFAGCKETRYWEFEYTHEKIVEIKIVEIHSFNYQTDKDYYTVVKELDLSLAKDLWEDVSVLTMERMGPSPVEPHGNSFLIVFESGEFDIISIVGSTHFEYADGVIQSYISFLYSNEMEYEQLLNKYLNA